MAELGHLHLDFAIVKVDDERRQVWGYATVEQPDKQGDIVDYQASVEAFRDWPGNIREQHDPRKAIGRAIEVKPDPDKKGIWVGAYISKSRDGEDTWTKIKEGILRAFSIKGVVLDSRPEVVKLGDREQTCNRITKYRLDELSLVDNPACPEALIHIVKNADGTLVSDVLAEPVAGVEKRDYDPNVGGGVDRDKIPDEDFAGPDRSFPIVTPGDVEDAVRSLGRTKHDRDEIKRRIIEIAYRKGKAFVDRLPDDWKRPDDRQDKPDEDGGKAAGMAGTTDRTDRVVGRALRKHYEGSSFDIQNLCDLLTQLALALDSERAEAESGGDADDLVQIDNLRRAVQLVLDTLRREFVEYYGAPGSAADAPVGDLEMAAASAGQAAGPAVTKTVQAAATPATPATLAASVEAAAAQEDTVTRDDIERVVADTVGRVLSKQLGGSVRAETFEKVSGELAKLAEAVSRLEKVAEAVGELDKRLTKIEQQPDPHVQAPALMAVEKTIGVEIPSGRPGQLSDAERTALERLIEKTNDPYLRQRLGAELAMDELRKIYRS